MKRCCIETAKKSIDKRKHKTSRKKSDAADCVERNVDRNIYDETVPSKTSWKPLLLILPLRLGLTEINPVYVDGLKVNELLNNTQCTIY